MDAHEFSLAVEFLALKGLCEEQIKAQVLKSDPNANERVVAAQIKGALKAARKRWEEKANESPEQATAERIARANFLYAASVRINDFKTALAVEKHLAEVHAKGEKGRTAAPAAERVERIQKLRLLKTGAE